MTELRLHSVSYDLWKMQCVVMGAVHYDILIVIGSQPTQSLQFDDMLFLLKMLNLKIPITALMALSTSHHNFFSVGPQCMCRRTTLLSLVFFPFFYKKKKKLI